MVDGICRASWNYGPVHFVSINTETDWSGAEEKNTGDSHDKKLPAGHFGKDGEYLEWLEADLKKVSEARARARAGTAQGQEFAPAFIVAGGLVVCCVLCCTTWPAVSTCLPARSPQRHIFLAQVLQKRAADAITIATHRLFVCRWSVLCQAPPLRRHQRRARRPLQEVWC